MCNDDFHFQDDVKTCLFTTYMHYSIPVGDEVFDYSPYMDTDENEFFQYIEVNFSPIGYYSINGEDQNESYINRQEHHQKVEKLKSKHVSIWVQFF